MKKLIILLLILVLSSSVYAAGEIVQHADKLNYWNGETHTVTLTNTGTLSTQLTISKPTGWSFGVLSGCTISGPTITCNVGANSTASYQLLSNSSDAEYKITTVPASTNNSYTANSVKFIKIKDDEIFHTLVEYGRGRGNYFFDSMGTGLAGSGHTGTGCAYLPNGTLFELNFLHKILNIQQYFGFADAEAANASFRCTYPDKTVVRQHLVSSILRSGGLWTVDYFISTITGSWERMGYLGMNVDAGEYTIGQNISVNCTNMSYFLPKAGGHIVVGEDSFKLQVRNREPFTVTASTATGTIGNGTQEVIISYTITNNEAYDAKNVIVEIEAPKYAKFIGTRGELWGAAQDQYRIEKTEILTGKSETIDLVARFDTAHAPNISSLALSQGVKIEYITCWEINAYNPQEYMQYLAASTNVSVNMGTPVTIVSVIDLLKNINITISNVYSTVNVINNTVDDIWNLTNEINISIDNLPYKVWTFYSRNLTYYPPVVSYNITMAGGIGGAGGGVACRWNESAWYNNSLASSAYYQIYNSGRIRTDFRGLYNGSVDLYRTCYRIAPSSATTSNDTLEVYLCNNYDGAGNPETETGCTLVDAYSISQGTFIADKFTWECADVLGKEVYGKNVSIILGCKNCAGTTDSWKLALDSISNITTNYTFTSANNGSSWSLGSNESLIEWDWCVPIDFGYEVWHYNNRSLTENVSCAAGTCNITLLLNQFNCTNGAATNKMCEIIYAINETSNNMWSTIQIMNGTLSNVWNYSQLIYGDTKTIIDLLNCNGSVDSYLCNLTMSINNSITTLTTTINNINSSVNSISNTLYIMNQSIMNQFNYTQQLIQNISINVGNLSVSMNCSSLTVPSTNESICNAIGRIDTNIVSMNTTLNQVLSVVNYINGTRWGNVTAWDIYTAIQNQSTYITNNIQNIVNSLSQLKEFNEELVFLVTDAFGLQQSAKKDLDNGDLTSAADKLREANNKLNEAAMNLINEQATAAKEATTDDGTGFMWVLLLVGLITIGAMSFYLFSKPKQ